MGKNVLKKNVPAIYVGFWGAQKGIISSDTRMPLALFIQHAKCMGPFILSSWAVCLYRIFPHYLINGTIFEKKVTEHKMRVLIFSTTFV
jgi:hypothetical protein